MNRRDFLKMLGAVPLIGLAAKLPEVKDQKCQVEFDGLTTSDIRTDGCDLEVGETGWHFIYNDNGEVECVEIDLNDLSEIYSSGGWTYTGIEYSMDAEKIYE